MTTKYYCDICGKETSNHRIISTTTQNVIEHKFDVCDSCISSHSLKVLVETLLKKLGTGSPAYYGAFKIFKLDQWDYFKVREE